MDFWPMIAHVSADEETVRVLTARRNIIAAIVEMCLLFP